MLLLFILVCQSAGLIGSLFTFPAIDSWYAGLIKPSFSPPNWLFGPAWTTLYTLMGIAIFLIWLSPKENKERDKSFVLFFTQLILNTLWSIIFFGLKNPLLAFVEILLLWALILLTTIQFYKVNKSASFLMIPYILWVSFASVLNLFIFLLN